MVSIEQFAESIGQMILSGHLGRMFDRVSRKIGKFIVDNLYLFILFTWWSRKI